MIEGNYSRNVIKAIQTGRLFSILAIERQSYSANFPMIESHLRELMKGYISHVERSDNPEKRRRDLNSFLVSKVEKVAQPKIVEDSILPF